METVYTRDVQIPLVDGDDTFEFGFSCVPMRTDNDESWFIFDTSKDYKTGWMRIKNGGRSCPR